MLRETFPVGPLRCNCSILADEVSREAMVVDPGDDIPKILAFIAQHQLKVKQIIITHAHIDHIAGAQRLKEITGAPVLYNKADLMLVSIMSIQASWLGIETPDVREPDSDLPDGSTLSVSGLSATIIHTPGHTPGSVCMYLPEEKLLLAGDTLFAGSIGRTDLPGGDETTLLRSIHQKLLVLPGETEVIAGHGAPSRIEIERAQNPFLQT